VFLFVIVIQGDWVSGRPPKAGGLQGMPGASPALLDYGLNKATISNDLFKFL